MLDHGRHASRRPLRHWLALAGLILTAPGLVACSRDHYRRQADREVQCLIESGSTDPRWPLDDYTIHVDPRSRFFDPGNPDCPPMPPDDPTSHELMHCVDGMKGWKHWGKYGSTQFVENPLWRAYLPLDEDGTLVLDRTAAVELALIHSREYRQEIEDLYLSALTVSFERFQFDVRFFGGNNTFFTTRGPLSGDAPSSTQLANDAFLQMRKNLATGGEIVAGVANSIVWEFSGPNGYRATTPITFSLVQPLLRAAGRAVALEGLTQAERDLLANIRQMERFRRGFYSLVVAGRSGVAGPSPGRVGIPSVGGGFPGGAGGFLQLLEQQVRIRNQESNLQSTQDSLSLMEAQFAAGRVDLTQVERIRQDLYSAQSGLLTSRAAYDRLLDNYKFLLGLPPGLKMRIEDPLLAQFDLIDPRLRATEDAVDELLDVFRDDEAYARLNLDWYDRLLPILDRSYDQIAMVEEDLVRLEQALPRREANLRMLATRPEVQGGQVNPEIFSTDALYGRFEMHTETLQSQTTHLENTFVLIESIARAREADAQAPGTMTQEARDSLRDLLTLLKDQLLELSLLQAKTRLDTASLIPIQISAERALEIARVHRRDWMNARAALVDQWRQIEIAANALRSDLNVVAEGRIDPVSNNLFGAANNHTTGTLNLGLEFDAPLTRLVERNNYRRALINYQRTRREYNAFEDRMEQLLRDAERVIRLSQIDFEVRRAAVFVAITRVDMERIKLTKPAGERGTGISLTAALDVQDSLNALLAVQNNFLSTWVNYEAQRMNLDLELGTMELDDRGMWIDPGPMIENGDLVPSGLQALPPVAPPVAPPLAPPLAPQGVMQPAPMPAQAGSTALRPLPPIERRTAYGPTKSAQARQW